MNRFTRFVTVRRGWLIRLVGSAILLGVLAWFLPVEAVLAAFRSIPPAIFLGVLGLFLVAHVAAALKWWMLLDCQMPVGQAIRAHFAGLAANLCLPGAVGGDAVRAALAQNTIRDGSRVVAVATADRLIDMLALVSLAILGLFLTRNDGVNGMLVFQAAAFLIAVGLGVLALPRLIPIPWKIIPHLPGRGVADKFGAAFASLGQRPGLLARAFVLSLMIQTSLVAMSWWLAISVSATVTLAQWMFAWPLAKVIAVVPISLNGLGLREAALAANLSAFGASATLIVAAGLVWQAVLFLAGGFGAVFFALSRPAKQITNSKVNGISE